MLDNEIALPKLLWKPKTNYTQIHTLSLRNNLSCYTEICETRCVLFKVKIKEKFAFVSHLQCLLLHWGLSIVAWPNSFEAHLKMYGRREIHFPRRPVRDLLHLHCDILRSKPDHLVYVYPPFPQLILHEMLIASFLRCQYQSNLEEGFGSGMYTEEHILEIHSPVFLSALR